ncbi:MAG TPA: hypothetical protein VFD43_13020 [Planctomycetota bacterium]|nr:hypothetical protein [Planctomycetota bacterium]
MRASPVLPAVLGLVLLLGGCTLIDVRSSRGGGVHSDAFVSGYADAGWPASDSIFKVGLFDGPSDGALLYLQVWKLLRIELGFIGLALGIGPLDAGVGVLFYDPHPPAYVDWDEDEGAERHEHEDDEDAEHDHEHPEDEAAEPETVEAGEGDAGHAFVYKVY